MSAVQWRIEQYPSLASTSDPVLERARAGEAEGLVVVAAEQTQGRGRHGRRWLSPAGNLYMSVLLRPTRPMREFASLSPVAGLAACRGIMRATSGTVRPRLKWPNDVLAGEAKLGGILLEAAAAEGSAAVVVGIGINVRTAPQLAGRPAVALADLLPVAPAPAELARHILDGLAALYALWNARGFAPLRDDWLAAAHGLGEQVTLRIGERQVRGRFLAIDGLGRLELEEETGGRRTYDAGELFFGAPPLARTADTG